MKGERRGTSGRVLGLKAPRLSLIYSMDWVTFESEAIHVTSPYIKKSSLIFPREEDIFENRRNSIPTLRRKIHVKRKCEIHALISARV